jgi:hypothetical protein
MLDISENKDIGLIYQNVPRSKTGQIWILFARVNKILNIFIYLNKYK